MISIIILGTGNVAKHLFDVFLAQDGVDIVQVYGRNNKVLSYFEEQTETTSNLSTIAKADIYIMAVSDDAIGQLSKELKLVKGLLVHTSGSVSMKTLPKKVRRGVFYPLQTFSVNRRVDFNEIPICIEAENEGDFILLKQLATMLSKKVVHLDSKHRKSLHLAAVFANNFTNHIYSLSQEYCEKQGLQFELLLPMIKETANKLADLTPYDAQTGPARRNDKGTMKNHLAQLKSKKHKKIYSLLSKSIQETYGEKL